MSSLLIPRARSHMRAMRNAYSNSVSALIPQIWSKEFLMLLVENMVMGNLVYRDFENEIANFGDTVNTRKPATFTGMRKGVNDDVTVQDVTLTNVPVKLNQHVHVAFIIKDAEQSKSFADLVRTHLVPAVQANARYVDQVLTGQVYQFRANNGGLLGGMNSTNSKDYILDTRQTMNTKKVPEGGRNMLLTVATDSTVLKNDWATSAYISGDQGKALREASIGHKLGFEFVMGQNTPYIPTGNTTNNGAINNSSGYAAGTTTFTVNGFTGAVVTGGWITIAGDMTPLRITAHSESSSNTTSITVAGGTKRAVVHTAVVTTYTPGAVNNSSNYALGYDGAITVDGFTVAPQVGQLVSFGTASPIYAVIGAPTTTSIVLDRPLDAAISDNDVVGIGPAGNYNFAFHRNALALVSRPLGLPLPGAGAIGAVVSWNGLSVRTTISYDGRAQGHLVTLDLLLGVAVLDTDLGAVMYG